MLATNGRERLRLPVIATPMNGVSGPELVVAACRHGVVGSIPTHDALGQRAGSVAHLDERQSWFGRRTRGPIAPNLVVHGSNRRRDADVECLAAHGVGVVITSVGSPEAVVPRHGRSTSPGLRRRLWVAGSVSDGEQPVAKRHRAAENRPDPRPWRRWLTTDRWRQLSGRSVAEDQRLVARNRYVSDLAGGRIGGGTPSPKRRAVRRHNEVCRITVGREGAVHGGADAGDAMPGLRTRCACPGLSHIGLVFSHPILTAFADRWNHCDRISVGNREGAGVRYVHRGATSDDGLRARARLVALTVGGGMRRLGEGVR